jgi:hypothetical protein
MLYWVLGFVFVASLTGIGGITLATVGVAELVLSVFAILLAYVFSVVLFASLAIDFARRARS